MYDFINKKKRIYDYFYILSFETESIKFMQNGKRIFYDYKNYNKKSESFGI